MTRVLRSPATYARLANALTVLAVLSFATPKEWDIQPAQGFFALDSTRL
jgi:hypothetical protein